MPPDLNLRVLPRTVQQETVDKLRLAIFSGIFEPGSRLVESQLCVQLGISRPSLREALRSLAAEKLIEIIPNRGPSVTQLTWDEVNSIYEARELLEVEAVGRCSQLITPAALEKLELSLGAFEEAASSNDGLARITTAAEFYAIILANCGNPILERSTGAWWRGSVSSAHARCRAKVAPRAVWRRCGKSTRR